MADNFLLNLLRPEDLVFRDGKIHARRTLTNNYEIYINGDLVKTIHNSSDEVPTEEEVNAALRDEGIEPEKL